MCSSTIPWLTLSFNYYPNNLQQPPLSRLSSGHVGLFKAPVTDGPQSAAVYLSITHSEAKRWRSLSQRHQHLHTKLKAFSYFSIILCFNNTILYFSYGKITDPATAVFYGAAIWGHDGKQYEKRGKIIFQWFCIYSQNLSFLSQKVLCSSLETLCSLPQHLHFLAKLVHSPETLRY